MHIPEDKMKIFKGIPCGEVYNNGNTSTDYYSLNHEKCNRDIRNYTWYDILPYAPALWIQHYKENVRKGSWWLHREKYSNICIEYVRSGSAEYTVDGKTATLSPGEILVTFPGCSITVSDHNANTFHRVQVIVSGGIAKIAPETLGLLKLRHYKLKDTNTRRNFDRLLDQIFRIISEQSAENAQNNSRLAYELLLFLTGICEEQSSQPADLPDVLTSTLNRMSTGKLEEESISTLARQAGVSRMTLNNLFRKHLNTTPLAYWMKLKMEHAQQLLCRSNMNIKAISVDLGFKNQLYFSTVFRRYFGSSPTEYRKKHKKQ